MRNTETVERNRSTCKLDRKDSVESLRRLATELGHTPTAKECDTCAYTPAVSTLVFRFGSYNKAMIAAGLRKRETTGGRRQVHSRERSVAALRRLAEELGRTPKALECQRCGYTPSVNTLIRQFGTYNDALIAAELTPNDLRKVR